MDLSKITHSKVLEALPLNNKISLALDCWTSQDQKPFLVIIGYFVSKEYKFHEVLLGFQYIKGSHEGAHLADIVMDILNEHNLCSHVLAITTDNISNNWTLMGAVVGRLNNSFNPNHPLIDQPHHLPCLAHVIQITVYAFLQHLNIESQDEEISTRLDDAEKRLVCGEGLPGSLKKVYVNGFLSIVSGYL